MGRKSEEAIRNFTHKYSQICVDNNAINPELFNEYGVKRGLRDKNGKGVLSGLTNISMIKSSEEIDGKSVPCDGELYYRGYNIFDLVRGFQATADLALMNVHIFYCSVICRQPIS